MKFFLIGMPGSGKSTLGKPLAESLKIPFLDLDSIIEEREGMAVREIFHAKGEQYFRNLEAALLKERTNEDENFVLATGGGTPCFFNNVSLMKEAGKVIFLNVPIEKIVARLQKEGTAKRPLLKDYDTPEKLFDYLKATFLRRKTFYDQADFILKDEMPVEDLIQEIRNNLYK